MRAEVPRLANSCLESRNTIGNQSGRKSQRLETLPVVRALLVICGWSKWPALFESPHWGSCLGQGWPSSRAPSVHHAEQFSKLVSISRSAHATCLPESGVKAAQLSTVKFPPLPGNCQAERACFLCSFQSFCAPPRRASWPPLSKVEFPDGNHNYKHMLLLSAAIGLASFSFKGEK